MDTKNDAITDLLIANTILTTRLVRTVSAFLEILRDTVPDFEKRYLAALFPPQGEPELSKLLTELAEAAQKLALASPHSDEA